MDMALAQARLAQDKGEVPVGAVIVHQGEIVATGHNLIRINKDPTAHAEIIALRAAAKYLGNERLIDCDLYVTLEPCAMCAGAISHARIRRLYYGAADEKAGAVDHGIRFFDHTNCHHRPDVYGGISETKCQMMLRDFFQTLR